MKNEELVAQTLHQHADFGFDVVAIGCLRGR
jgi:hypothetical protein